MSRLVLNDQVVPFKEFHGENYEQMRKLIAEGRTPLSVAGLIQRRLEVLTGYPDGVKSSWWENYFDTGDGVFCHSNGNIKVVIGAQPIRDLTFKRPRSYDYVALNRDCSVAVYDSLEGAEFKRSDLEKKIGKEQIGRMLTKKEVKMHPIWNALVTDKALLEEYVDVTFAQGRERYGFDCMMGVWVPSPQKDATGQILCVGSVGAATYGGSSLGPSVGLLVGVAPETRAARK